MVTLTTNLNLHSFERLMGILKFNINIKIIRFYCDTLQPVVMKYLNVAEKNDAAKNIAAILSRGNSNRVSPKIYLNKMFINGNYYYSYFNLALSLLYINEYMATYTISLIS